MKLQINSNEESQVIEMMRDKGRMDALDLKSKLATIDKQEKEILSRLDAMGGGDTVAVSTLDEAYRKGVNSVE